MAIDIKSFNQFLGNLARKIRAGSVVDDVNDGSTLMQTLEAIAGNDFENSVAILNTLELLNIDAVRNNDLDAAAANLGLSRTIAIKAAGDVTISDSSMTKRSTSLYSIKPAPIAGLTQLFVNDASEWAATGTLFIGRNTENFEGPINYTSIVDNGTFFTISLATALQKDHLISETVIDAQGTTDRVIPAGTRVKIPSNNLSDEIGYTLLREAILPAGEDSLEGVAITAETAGTLANAGINTITEFDTVPFTNAQVSNASPFTNGRDVESDIDLRNRIKSYTDTLARGTIGAIITAIDGLSDTDENKQVTSAVITEPAQIGDPSIVYVDDGNGFEPSFLGQSVDELLKEASGNEEFLQLANFPLPRAQVINTAEAPYELVDGMSLRILIDEAEESITFNTTDFVNISSATLNEIIVAINDKATSFKARLTDTSSQILIFTESFTAETIQIVDDSSTLDANNVLKFPVNEFSYVTLYQNNVRLKEKETAATLTSAVFSSWNITSSGNLILSVDGTPLQDQTFDTSDFGGTPFAALTVSDYAEAINNKFAGVTATTTTTDKLIISSNKEGAVSSIEVLGGTFASKIFSGVSTSDAGQDSNFSLNRQNGNLQLLTSISEGDTITAGSEDIKGRITSNSASSGIFNVSTDSSGRPSEMIIVADADRVFARSVSLTVSSVITITDEGSSVMRIMVDTASPFRELQPGDYIYIANRGDIDGLGTGSWLDIKDCGLYKIKTKGEHTSAGINTYVEVLNDDIIGGGPYSVSNSLDVQAFFSDSYPQLWNGTFVADPEIGGTPAAAEIQEVIDSINLKITNVTASMFRTNFIKLTSTTEDNGSIAIPVSVGNATLVFDTGLGDREGSQSHIANKKPTKDAITIFQRTAPVSTDVWLDRHTYTDVKGSLTSNAVPGANPLYSETLIDTLNTLGANSDFNSLISLLGNNKRLYKTIQEAPDSDTINTRIELPTTLLDHVTGDEYQLVKSLEASSEDSIVTILDNDSIGKTVDVPFSRRGRINAGSQAGAFLPINGEFSANDDENETGIDFGTLSVWGTLASQTNTNFNDYAIWFRARNWYATGGVGSGASMMLRVNEYGPAGDNYRFNINYPIVPNLAEGFVSHTNTPESTTLSYTFGSDAPRITALISSDQVSITEPVANTFRMTFPGTADFSTTVVDDIVTIGSVSGFSSVNQGTFRISAVNDTLKTLDIFNPSGVITVIGIQEERDFTFPAASAITTGQYFTIDNALDANQYYVWFDKDAGGGDPLVVGRIAIPVSIVSADTASNVATIASAAIAAVNGGLDFAQTGVSLPTVTLQNVSIGASTDAANVDVSGAFSTTTTTQGVTETFETIANVSDFIVYPLLGTNISSIISKINESDVMNAVEIDSGSIVLSTFEEIATISFGFSSNDLYVGMHDASSWVSDFQNANPNFTLKKDLVLPTVEPTIYKMDTTVNTDATIGELFKLVPITLANLHHQLSHKALSQLEIVSDVNIVDNFRKVQIKSEKLGSQGAIEVVGGRANEAIFSIIGNSSINNFNSIDYLELRTTAFPDTLNIGHHVELKNANGVRRFDRLSSTDTMNVVKITDITFEYRYNGKTTDFDAATTITITDSSASHGRPAGTVWRWTHSTAGTETLQNVAAGDLVTVYGSTLAGWSVGNTAGATGDGEITGLPIIEVGAAYIDVVNPNGAAMGATVVDFGAGERVEITPTPIIEWNLSHIANTTKYKIESLGYNDMFRLSATTDSPNFTDFGVAVDDLLVISGDTFQSLNSGSFRVLAVDNDSIIYSNPNGFEELNTIVEFNGTSTAVTWTANSDTITGSAGDFVNVSVGDWIKKQSDNDTFYIEVITVGATSITLGTAYKGTTSNSIGVAFDQVNNVGTGLILGSIDDIRVYEGDAVRVADELFVSALINTSWFNVGNQGTFDVIQYGTNSTDYKPFIRVTNAIGVVETGILMSVLNTEIKVIEGTNNKFTSIKQVAHEAIDDGNNQRRKVYLTPGNRDYKWSQTNGTFMQAIGKIGYDDNIVTGVDGYLYYTGLMRSVQRTIDGFEPDTVTYPGFKGAGSIIEALPPLKRPVSITIDVTTADGANLDEITDEIKSTIISYIRNLDVGGDVILSEIVVRVKNIDGVEAVTFVTPIPSTERISISSDEKAFIEVNDISVA